MSFSFGGSGVPITLKVARALLFTEAAYYLLAAAFMILVGSVLGSELTLGTTSLSGRLPLAIGALYAGVAVVLFALGLEVSRQTAWGRYAVIGSQVVVTAGTFLAQGSSVDSGNVIVALAAITIVSLVLWPVSPASLPDGPAPLAIVDATTNDRPPVSAESAVADATTPKAKKTTPKRPAKTTAKPRATAKPPSDKVETDDLGGPQSSA